MRGRCSTRESRGRLRLGSQGQVQEPRLKNQSLQFPGWCSLGPVAYLLGTSVSSSVRWGSRSCCESLRFIKKRQDVEEAQKSSAGTCCVSAGGWTGGDCDRQSRVVAWGFLVWRFSSVLSHPCNLWVHVDLGRMRMEPSLTSGIQTSVPSI